MRLLSEPVCVHEEAAKRIPSVRFTKKEGLSLRSFSKLPGGGPFRYFWKDKRKMTRKKTQKQKKQIYLPALFLLTLWPCLVHLETLRTGMEQYPWFPDVTYQDDFFMYIRSIALLAAAVWMLAVLADRMMIQRIRPLSIRRMWPVLLYGGMVILSTLLSADRDLSVSFVTEQCETIWVLLGYVAVFFYFADIAREEGCMPRLMGYTLAGAAIQCLVGLSQMAGHDFWSSYAGRTLITLGRGGADTLQFSFAEGSTTQVYMSFYNPNYAAVYLILMLPIAVCAVNVFEKKWQKSVCAVLAVLMLICLWGSKSKAGMITVVLLLTAAGIVTLGGGRRKLFFLLGLAVCFLAYAVIGYLHPADSTLEKIIKNAFPKKQEYRLQKVTPGEDEVLVVFNNETFHLRIDEAEGRAWFSVSDENGTALELNYKEETGLFSLAERNYTRLQFAAYKDGEESHIIMYRNEIPWEFVKKDTQSPYQYYTIFGKADTPVNAPYAFGKGYERAFSGRIYLWSRTLPLMKNYLLWGSGPNTYTIVFPQNDYVAQANVGVKMLSQIKSRPHSIYLQIAVQTGLLSLAALVILWARYLAGAYKQLWQFYSRGKGEKCQDSLQKQRIILAVTLSVTGFLVMGLANDSVVVTSPVFWAILGAGYGLMF